MITKIQKMTYLQQILTGVGICIITGALGGALLDWRTQEVQGSKVSSLEYKVNKLEDNAITIREYIEFQKHMDSQFNQLKELIREEKVETDILSKRLDNHIGLKQ